MALLAGMANVFFATAYQAYLPSLVMAAELMEGNAKLQGSASAAAIGGRAAAGLAAQAVGAAAALLFNAASFVVSAACLLFIREPVAALQVMTLRAPGSDRLAVAALGWGHARNSRRRAMPLRDPWFWAFLGALGWGLCTGLVGSRALGGNLRLGMALVLLAEVPRALLPLPFVVQPRIEAGHPALIASGAAVLAGSLVFAAPVFRIAPFTAPAQREPLRTDGLYSVVRHPLMVCDIFWPLGASLIFGSIIGIALTAVWLLMVWVLTRVEEEALVREYGDVYRDFQARVPRLFPRLPIADRGRPA